MRVSQDVLTVLDRAHTEGNALHLPGQLERKLYVKTDAVLKAAGGKWNRKVRAHLSRMTRPPPSSRCWSAPSPYQVVGIYSP